MPLTLPPDDADQQHSPSLTAKTRRFMATTTARIQSLVVGLLSPIRAMNWKQRIFFALFFGIAATLTVSFMVWNKEILAFIEPYGQRIREHPFGWIIPFVLIVIACFPPLLGFSSTLTFAGFLYGFPYAWFLVVPALTLGSTLAFLICRAFFRNWMTKQAGSDRRFMALCAVLEHEGLRLLCLIRWCPFPFSLSNGAMSTVPTVSAKHFAIATLVSSPKYLIHVFIGSRLAHLAAEPEADDKTKMINYASIVVGSLMGSLTGYIIYKRTSHRAAVLEQEAKARADAEGRTVEDAYRDSLDEGPEGGDGGNPFVGRYRDEEESVEGVSLRTSTEDPVEDGSDTMA